jgi:hypothetical protein
MKCLQEEQISVEQQFARPNQTPTFCEQAVPPRRSRPERTAVEMTTGEYSVPSFEFAKLRLELAEHNGFEALGC